MARAKAKRGKQGDVAERTQTRKGRRRGARGGRAGEGNGGKMRKHDWPALREEFMRATREEGKPVSLEWFAQEKGISYSMLRERAGAENWHDKRSQYWGRVHALAREKAAEKMAAESAEQDTKDFRYATGIIQLGQRNVDYLEGKSEGARPTDLAKMAKAGTEAQRMHRIAAGRPLPAEGGQQQVNVNLQQPAGLDPMERLRRKIDACRDAGMDVEETVQGFCQMMAQELLGADYVVRLERRKALPEGK